MPGFIASAELKLQLEPLASQIAKDKGTILFRRGEDVSGVFIIRRGKVKLQLDCAGGNFLPRTLGPGSVLGVPATLSGTAYSLTAEVVEDSELGYVPRQAVIAVLRSNPQLCFQVMEMLSEEISGMRAAIKCGDQRPEAVRRHLAPAKRS